MRPFATHRFLTRAALSGAHVFAWLFVFQYFYIHTTSLVLGLSAVAISYALAQTIAVLVTPLVAHRLRRGVRGMLVNALLALAASYALLAAAFSGWLGSVSLGIMLFSIGMGLYRSLYWIPYELVSKKHTHGKVTDVVLAFLPALSGFVMTLSPVGPLFVLVAASLISLIAIIPVYSFKNTHEGFSWSYRGTFRHLFTASHRRPLLQAICNGFEGAALLLMWPIVILVLLNWSYQTLGMVLSITYLCTIVARSLVSRVHHRVQTPIILSALSISGWILRGTIVAPVSIVLVDTYYQSGSGVSQRGVDLLTSEQSADSNTYIDEFTALKDMGQGIGRILFCLVLVALTGVFSFAAVGLALFLCASLAAVTSIILSQREQKRAF